MPGFIAKQLCPDLIFVKPHYNKYKEATLLTRFFFFFFFFNIISLSFLF